MDSDAYRFLKEPPISYFSQHIRGDVDLSNAEPDEELFGGRLASVARQALDYLSGLDGLDIRNLLLLGDFALAGIVEGGGVTIADGETRSELTRDVLAHISEIELAAHVGKLLHEMPVHISDPENGRVELVQVTAERFYAAFALSECYAATRYGKHVDWLLPNGAFHAMQAAEAVGLAKGVSGRTTLVQVARRAAEVRWSTDPSQVTKASVHEEFRAWRTNPRLYRQPRDFRRAMQLRFPDLVDGTLKNWMSQWGREET